MGEAARTAARELAEGEARAAARAAAEVERRAAAEAAHLVELARMLAKGQQKAALTVQHFFWNTQVLRAERERIEAQQEQAELMRQQQAQLAAEESRRRRLERQRHDAITAERAARAERGAETER